MAKFNVSSEGSEKTINYEGEEAYKLSPALELYSTVVTSSLSKKFYESTDDRMNRIIELIKKNDPEFVAKLAVYAREEMYLRSIPLVLAVELAKIHSGDDLVRRVVNRVVARADEITELLAYYQISNDRKDTKKLNKLSNQVRKGLADSMNKFGEYSFGKYNRKKEITLKDALFLTHPKPKDKDQQLIFDKIANDNLEIPKTWETELSKLGQQKFESESEKEKAFKAKWEEIIDMWITTVVDENDSGKIKVQNVTNIMAILRNLRNALQAGVSKKHIKKISLALSDEKTIRNSKQLPFRFLSAYRAIQDIVSTDSSILLDGLEKAIKISTENIKGYDIDIDVLISCDVSGSMWQPISEKSSIQNYEVGLVLGMLFQSKCESVITGMFGEKWKVVNLPRDNILSNANHLEEIVNSGAVGHSTNGYLAIKDLLNRKVKVDKVMVFTDMQLWDSNYSTGWGLCERRGSSETISNLWHRYKKEINSNAKIYLFDLAGYGNTPISVHEEGVYFIAGWSDKIFDILEALENGSTAIKEIEKVEI